MKYKSRKDWWLSVIVWGAMVFSLGIGSYSLIEKTTTVMESIIILSLSIILPIFILWMWLTTYYVITENKLIIRFGPFKKHIELDTIKSVKKTMNPLSSPALSLRRLEIVYHQYNSILISPLDREEFIEILSKRCPHIKIIT
ncbi:PH domain-containing protein [Metabacillus litoralis]|uniref:PH domain-containing protein n=1 Tax=Metabacillus litoralis TaxID=152268 RepID=UPI001CFF20DB|nr:PH domain-containing protein [Metabacillus litoralis]